MYYYYNYYTVCYFTCIFYAVVRQISMLFIDKKKDSVFCRMATCYLFLWYISASFSPRLRQQPTVLFLLRIWILFFCTIHICVVVSMTTRTTSVPFLMRSCILFSITTKMANCSSVLSFAFQIDAITSCWNSYNEFKEQQCLCFYPTLL